MTFMGILLIILGVVSIAAPFVAGVSLTLMLGFVLLAAGICQLVWAFQSETFGRGLMVFLWGGLTILAGGYTISRPAAALAGLTVFLAMYFFISGLMDVFLAFRIKPVEGWGWTLFSGVVSVVLGVMIWRQFPTSAAWLIGTLVGIKLLFVGLTMSALTSAVKAVANALPKITIPSF